MLHLTDLFFLILKAILILYFIAQTFLRWLGVWEEKKSSVSVK